MFTSCIQGGGGELEPAGTGQHAGTPAASQEAANLPLSPTPLPSHPSSSCSKVQPRAICFSCQEVWMIGGGRNTLPPPRLMGPTQLGYEGARLGQESLPCPQGLSQRRETLFPVQQEQREVGWGKVPLLGSCGEPAWAYEAGGIPSLAPCPSLLTVAECRCQLDFALARTGAGVTPAGVTPPPSPSLLSLLHREETLP